MIKNLRTTIIAPEAVTYVQLKLPSNIFAGAALSDEVREIVLQEIQGEAVEVSDEYPIPILMAAFDVAHRVSPEMVLRLKSGKRVLLFKHWTKEILREAADIIEFFSEAAGHGESKEFTPELVIDLGSIWKKYGSLNNDDLESIKNALNTAETLIKPAEITTFVGKAPVLLFLLAQHLLYGKTGEIWYQENFASAPIRITRL
jgi:hypothetical protein